MINNRSAAIAATIPAGELAVHVLGHTTPGVGSAIYREVPDTGTLEPWQFRSNGNTRRWELSEPVVNELMFGADPTGVADSFPAIQAAMNYCSALQKSFTSASGNFSLSDMVRCLSSPGNYKRGSSWVFNNNSVYTCTAATTRAAMFKFGNDDSNYSTSMLWNSVIRGGVFNCNYKAQTGIWVAWCNKVLVSECEVRNMANSAGGYCAGVKVGSNQGVISYEGFVQNCKILGAFGPPLIPHLSEPRGIYFENCTDNQTESNLIQGVRIGIEGDLISGWDGKHSNNHFWNWSENAPMAEGFRLYGKNKFVGNQFDGVMRCFVLLAGNNNIIGCGLNNVTVSTAIDNLTKFVWLFGASAGATAQGCHLIGDATHRILAEIEVGGGALAANYRKDGSNYYAFVGTVAPVNL